jgi:hypothetical protein
MPTRHDIMQAIAHPDQKILDLLTDGKAANIRITPGFPLVFNIGLNDVRANQIIEWMTEQWPGAKTSELLSALDTARFWITLWAALHMGEYSPAETELNP